LSLILSKFRQASFLKITFPFYCLQNEKTTFIYIPNLRFSKNNGAKQQVLATARGL